MSRGPKVIKLFSCSTQLSMKLKLLVSTDISLNHQSLSIILLIDVNMPTIAGILTFMSRINFMLI